MIVAGILADLLELVKLALLDVGKMGQMARGILHRLDSLQIGHGHARDYSLPSTSTGEGLGMGRRGRPAMGKKDGSARVAA